MNKLAVALRVCALDVFSLAACNTVSGIGRTLERVGRRSGGAAKQVLTISVFCAAFNNTGPSARRELTMKICVPPGDGIGLEIMAEAVRVLGRRFDLKFEMEEALFGGCAVDATGSLSGSGAEAGEGN